MLPISYQILYTTPGASTFALIPHSDSDSELGPHPLLWLLILSKNEGQIHVHYLSVPNLSAPALFPILTIRLVSSRIRNVNRFAAMPSTVTPCKHCGTQASSTQSSCPSCGKAPHWAKYGTHRKSLWYLIASDTWRRETSVSQISLQYVLGQRHQYFIHKHTGARLHRICSWHLDYKAGAL